MKKPVEEALAQLEALAHKPTPMPVPPAVVVEVAEVPEVAAEPVQEEPHGEVFEITTPLNAKYCVDDLALIFEVFLLDKRLAVSDLVLLAQARFYMSSQPDGKIPFVMRKGVVNIHRKYCGVK